MSGRPTDPVRVGLVLGGGGFPAMAFQAGTLLALETDFRWDPRSADVVVGTSAGSLVGAMLRAGLSSDDLAAWSAGAAAAADRQHLRDPIERSRQAGVRLAVPFSSNGPSIWSLLRSPIDFGLLDNSQAMTEASPLLERWPEQPLLITASTPKGRRIVFGGEQRPSLRQAIAASCAIPLVFPPVRIAGQRYVDGGVRSSTNADVLLDWHVDVAIIVSPMTGGSARRLPGPDAVLRRRARRALASEVARLRAAGVETVVFEPDAATVRSTGWNLLDLGRLRAVTRGAFLSATRDVDDAARAVLAGLHDGRFERPRDAGALAER
jgi:NTE family protein